MAPINLAQELGQARCHELMVDKRNRSSTVNRTGCWLYTGSKNNDGYGQVSPLPPHELATD